MNQICLSIISSFLVMIPLLSCGNSGSSAINRDSYIDSDTVSDSGVSTLDESDAIYDPNTIIEVVIEMDPDDWDLVRNEDRDLTCYDNAIGVCLNEPCYNTYTWKSGDVEINGKKVANVGIRKKGTVGSVNDEKPGLKLKFNKYVKDQLPFGMERMTLNNNVSDPAFIRQCLTYHVFRKSGSPAPRCNFATVKVNGENIGLYSNVEPIKKRFLARPFERNDGDLYESSPIADFREEWTGGYEPKTRDTDKERAAVLTLKDAVKVSDDALVATLDPLVDLGAFVKFWVLESLVNHSDGYGDEGTNCFFYFDPANRKMYAIPWGTDAALQPKEEQDPIVFTRTILPNRLYRNDAGREMFLDILRTVLDTVWDESDLVAEIDRMENLIVSLAASDTWYTSSRARRGDPTELAPYVDELRVFISDQLTAMESVLASPPTSVDTLANCYDYIPPPH